MDNDIRKILEEHNYILSPEEYLALINPIDDDRISYIKYVGDRNIFQVCKNNDFMEFKVESKVMIKKN